MIGELALLPDKRAVRRMDVAAAVWAAVFLLLGVLAGVELWRLSRVEVTLHRVSSAVGAAGDAVGLLARVPVVGSGAGRLAATIGTAAASVNVGADQVGSSARVLAVVIGLALALLGIAPLLVIYLPLRVTRRRELAALAALLAGDPDPLLVAHLAHAAVSRLPYNQLRRVTTTPWQDLADHRYHRLAAAELSRLGARVPDQWTDDPGTSP
ncbi:MAG: hypothetical protein ABI181_02945 [Mycobacteriaceae bacterium]